MAPETEHPVDLHQLQYCLAKNAPVMQILPDGNGKLRLGTLVRLPDGAEVKICGEGFDNRTAKVTWEGSTYYVFLDDLRMSRHRLTAACGA